MNADAALAATLKAARSQLGYTGTGTEDAPLSKYGAWYGINPGQWCAMYVSWVLATAGLPQHIETAKGFAYCPSGVNFFTARGAYTAKAWDHTPAPGDLAFYDFGLGRASHVGLVEAYTGGGIQTLEGNTTDASIGRTGNCCRRKWHPGDAGYILGYARPDYSAAAAAGGTEMALTPEIQAAFDQVRNDVGTAVHGDPMHPDSLHNVRAAVAALDAKMNPAVLAAALAPLLVAGAHNLSDADLVAVATAVNNEAGRRLRPAEAPPAR